jgi:HK97 family phage portal protein
VKINQMLSGAFGARSLSLQDVFDSGGDLSGVGFGNRHAGVSVDVSSAAQLTAVYGSWRIISEAVASLPRSLVVDGEPVGRPDWLDHPTEFDTWGEFASQVMVSLLQDGNAYILVDWGKGSGLVKQLTVLAPGLCSRVSRESVRVNGPAGVEMLPVFRAGVAGPGSVAEVLHVRGMTAPGSLSGISPIVACAQSLGISLGAQKYGSNFFEGDATPTGTLEVPAEVKLSEAGREATRQAWEDMHGQGRRRVAVLTEGMRYRQLQVSPDQAQFIENRKFTTAEVARIYGVPPHLLMDNSGTSGWGTAMAEMNMAFVQNTLRPHLVRLEGALSAVASREKGAPVGAVVDLDESALLRGDAASRFDILRKNVAAGLMTADEARESELLPALPGGMGAVPWVPLQQLPQNDLFKPALEAEKDGNDE